METSKNARVIAFYLPQFHPIPENDIWWGKGFTEWTNVGKAKPLFKGHYQPRVPADLGYYDLRMPEVREAQAEIAREAGIEGFCYWHYWFGNGKRLLERPFNEVLESGKPNFPFCLAWANETWTNKTWEKGNKRTKDGILMEQIYNLEDYKKHFYAILPAFKDKRYITVDDKPIFLVYKPMDLPDIKEFIDLWQELAKKNGLEKGIYFVGVSQNMDSSDQTISNLFKKRFQNLNFIKYQHLLDLGFNAINSRGYFRAEFYTRSIWEIIKRKLIQKLFNRYSISICKQSDINKYLYVPEDKRENIYPTLFPCWDRTARSGTKARVYIGSTPKVFRKQIQNALDLIKNKKYEHKILFLQSWNEWAEGNYVEPDLKYGHGFIDVIRDCIIKK